MAEELTRGRLLGYAVGSVGTGIVVVLNPIVGAWSDRTTAAGGTRTPWRLAGSIGGDHRVLVGITVVPVVLLAVSLPVLVRFARTSRPGAVVPA